MIDDSPDKIKANLKKLKLSKAKHDMKKDLKKVTILSLVYDIRFHDADDGDCYAGEGRRIVSCHLDRSIARAIASEFNPILIQAEKEHTIVPVQKFNSMLERKFGFCCHDVSDGYNFRLMAENFDLLAD